MLTVARTQTKGKERNAKQRSNKGAEKKSLDNVSAVMRAKNWTEFGLWRSRLS
jgi:hypothetical protein